MAEYMITTKPNRYWERHMVTPDETTAGDIGHYESPNVIKVGRTRYGIGYVSPEGTARRVQGGPLESGPYAYAFGLSSGIDNEGGTGAERAKNLAAGIEFDAEIGDILVIDGTEWEIERNGHRDIKLTYNGIHVG